MHIPLASYVLLLVAVVCETLGTSFLEKSEGMTRFVPVLLSLLFGGFSYVLGAHLLETMPMGVMYAVWCGIGIIIVSVLGYLINHQSLDTPALIGMALIGAGVVVIYLFSKSVAG